MKTEAELKSGDFIKQNDTLFKVIYAHHHAGTGKSGGTTLVKLRNVSNGATIEKKFPHGEKVDTVELTRKPMEYLYNEGDEYFFMDPVSFEQCSLKKDIIGKGVIFLTPNTKMPMDFYEGDPVSVVFPQYIEIKVTTAPPGIKGQDATYKEVELENGMTILAPQFIKEGEMIRIKAETGKYIEKAKKEKDKEKEQKQKP